jgi:hypothetical protein
VIRARIVSGLALACVVLIIILNGKPEFTNASRPPRGIRDPALALQVARNVKEVDAILSDAPSPDREAMRIKQYIDFAFIACYAALFIALARWFATRLAIAGAACGIGAAIADIVENISILRILDVPLAQTTQSMIDAIREPSYIKWTLTWIALAIFGVLFASSRGRLRKSIGAAFGVAAAIGFYGLADNAFLLWAGIPMALGLLLMVFLAFARRGRIEPSHSTA